MSLREAVKLPKQEIFDIVAKHLLTQNKPAMRTLTGNGGQATSCAYRANGLMCAIGCLLSDGEYNTHVEGLSVEELLPALKIAAPFEIVFLLGDLQHVHDSHPSVTWGAQLKEVATRHNLTFGGKLNEPA